MKKLSALFMGVAFGACLSASAEASDQTALLAHASRTVDDMRADGTFGPSRDLLRRARAVLIVPTLVKGGFMFGAEGGDGVLIARTRHGWSSPAFYTIGSASFGLQIGLEAAHMVMFIMSDRALRAVEQDKFKLGAGAGLTIVTVGANAQGATSGNLTGDLIVWSSTKGAYGGLTLEGSVLAPDGDKNADFYGRPVSVPAILADHVRNPDADILRHDLVAAR
jgi:lipid-binding SYLF domain-containing protein